MNKNKITTVSPVTHIAVLVGTLALVLVPTLMSARQPATISAQMQYSDSMYATGVQMLMHADSAAARN